MANFARVLNALDLVNGWNTLDTYLAAADTAAVDVLEGDHFGKAVASLVRDQAGQTWTGTAGELLELIRPDKPPKSWPKDATRAAGRLKRVAPLLRQIGISYDDSERQPDGNRSRLYTLTVIPGEEKDGNGAPGAPGTHPEQQEFPGASAGASQTQHPPAPGRASFRVLRVLARVLEMSQHPEAKHCLTIRNTPFRVLRVLACA